MPREYEPVSGLGAGDGSPTSVYVQPGGASPRRVTGGHAGCKGSSSAMSSSLLLAIAVHRFPPWDTSSQELWVVPFSLLQLKIFIVR